MHVIVTNVHNTIIHIIIKYAIKHNTMCILYLDFSYSISLKTNPKYNVGSKIVYYIQPCCELYLQCSSRALKTNTSI